MQKYIEEKRFIQASWMPRRPVQRSIILKRCLKLISSRGASAVSQGVEAAVKAFLNCVPDVPRAFHRAGRFTAPPPSFISLKVPAAIVEFRLGSSSEFEIKESSPFVLRFKRTGHLPDFRLEFPDNAGGTWKSPAFP